MRKEVSTHWGVDQYKDRKAIIYLQETSEDEEHYEVDYFENDKLIETREMITTRKDFPEGETVHSVHYAENAAENYCLGYMQVGDGRKQ